MEATPCASGVQFLWMHDPSVAQASQGQSELCTGQYALDGSGVSKAAARVLQKGRRLMSAGEISAKILEQGSTGSKEHSNPHNSKCTSPEDIMASCLQMDICHNKQCSNFIMPQQDVFGLRVWLQEGWLQEWLAQEGLSCNDCSADCDSKHDRKRRNRSNRGQVEAQKAPCRENGQLKARMTAAAAFAAVGNSSSAPDPELYNPAAAEQVHASNRYADAHVFVKTKGGRRRHKEQQQQPDDDWHDWQEQQHAYPCTADPYAADPFAVTFAPFLPFLRTLVAGIAAGIAGVAGTSAAASAPAAAATAPDPAAAQGSWEAFSPSKSQEAAFMQSSAAVFGAAVAPCACAGAAAAANGWASDGKGSEEQQQQHQTIAADERPVAVAAADTEVVSPQPAAHTPRTSLHKPKRRKPHSAITDENAAAVRAHQPMAAAASPNHAKPANVQASAVAAEGLRDAARCAGAAADAFAVVGPAGAGSAQAHGRNVDQSETGTDRVAIVAKAQHTGKQVQQPQGGMTAARKHKAHGQSAGLQLQHNSIQQQHPAAACSSLGDGHTGEKQQLQLNECLAIEEQPHVLQQSQHKQQQRAQQQQQPLQRSSSNSDIIHGNSLIKAAHVLVETPSFANPLPQQQQLQQQQHRKEFGPPARPATNTGVTPAAVAALAVAANAAAAASASNNVPGRLQVPGQEPSVQLSSPSGPWLVSPCGSNDGSSIAAGIGGSAVPVRGGTGIGAAGGGGQVVQGYAESVPAPEDGIKINQCRNRVMQLEKALGNMHPDVGAAYRLLAKTLQQEGSKWSMNMAQRAWYRARQIMEHSKQRQAAGLGPVLPP